jgi:hypothetical protein
MTEAFKSGLAFAAFLTVAIPLALYAQATPLSEKQKIELLIRQVAELKDTKFVRNGTAHNADTAATFLRRKWEANDSEVKTARDFVEKIASFSGTSGKPYLIRFKDGAETQSRDFLLAELKKIESL